MSEPFPPKPIRIAGVVAVLVAMAAIFFSLRRSQTPEPLPPVADLGAVPDWNLLQAYRGTASRQDIEQQLEEVYTIGDDWRNYITVADTALTVTGSGARHTIPLATGGERKPPPRYWRPVSELPALNPEDPPLQGLHIALDPGHIGGDYARIEERWFQIGDAQPVMEGEMVLRVAHHLAPMLRELGAKVSLVRKSSQPVTTRGQEEFEDYARRKLREGSPEEIAALSERLFYRTAEIRERARRVNEEIKPDLVVCLHFNAESWGDPLNPTLTDANHFHILVNGAYTPGEIAHEDERFEMLTRIFEGIHDEEAAVAEVVAESFWDLTVLRPYLYEPDSKRAININGNPYLWARNLLANRLYQCPVIFLEPYVMNSHEVHARIQAGDYEGMREINGRQQPSIYREYAEAVRNGLAEYYRRHRKTP